MKSLLMVVNIYYFILTLWVLIFNDPDKVFFQSEKIQGLTFTELEEEYFILDDKGQEVLVVGLKDEQGIPYWHRRMLTPVCLTGECNLIDIGIYWKCTGEFLGLEIYGEHLTKTDHSEFSEQDYERLMKILENDWSKLREYEISDLVDEVWEETPNVDGTSGATKKEIAAEAVEDAVYTTHTIWHLIHVGEKEQLMELTASELTKDPSLLEELLAIDHSNDFRLFVLKLISTGKFVQEDWINPFVIESLEMDGGREINSLAMKSLHRCDYTEDEFVSRLITIFSDSKTEEKIKLLSEFHHLDHIPAELFNAIVEKISSQPDWYIVKVFQLFKGKEEYRGLLRNIAGKLEDKDNTLLGNILKEYR
jgi:hypothetical protein